MWASMGAPDCLSPRVDLQQDRLDRRATRVAHPVNILVVIRVGHLRLEPAVPVLPNDLVDDCSGLRHHFRAVRYDRRSPERVHGPKLGRRAIRFGVLMVELDRAGEPELL
jgi:hypothetical protein